MRLPLIGRWFQPESRVAENAQPSRAEISYRDPILYPPGMLFPPYNPDIFAQTKGGLDIYERMRRDEQIKACQWIKRLAVLCSGWNVEAASEDGQDAEAADFVTDVFRRLGGTFEERIKEILSAMDYGFSITEKIWGYLDQGDFRGKISLRTLKTRKPHRWDFDTDEFGNLRPKGLWQSNGMYKYDPGKFVIYTHNKEFDNWYGTSDLQTVYRSWWSKDVIIRFWNMFLEKFGMGVPWLHPAENKDRIQEPTYTNLKNAIFNLQQGSAIAQQTGDALIEILESKRRGQGEYNEAIQYHDRAIGRGLLMPSGLGYADEAKGGGSYARSQTHFDVWVWVMQDLRKTVEEMINEQIVHELVDYNYSVTIYPSFKFTPLDEADSNELAKLWIEAINGRAVHPNADDELHFRKVIKFPERDRDELEDELEEEKAIKEEERKAKIESIGKPVFGGGQNGPGGKQKQGKDEKKTFSTRVWFRDLTKVERRVDFARIEKDLDGIEYEALTRLTRLLRKQEEKLIQTLEKALASGKIDQRWIQSLALQYGVEFQSEIKEFLRAGYEVGRTDAVSEISRAKKEIISPVIKIPPEATIAALEKNSFWIKNVTYDGLTKRIQGLLINSLETGEAHAETLMKVRAAYDPYVGDIQKVIDQKQIEPYRIETLIRTNTTKAYAWGKWAEFNDPDLEGYVRAVQLSAIIDTRTTDICRRADKKIVALDDPMAKRLLPPLHHNCRTVIIPITEVDGQFEPTKQVELTGVLEEMPPEFGGNVDK